MVIYIILKKRLTWSFIGLGLAIVINYAFAKPPQPERFKQTESSVFFKPYCDLVLNINQDPNDCYYNPQVGLPAAFHSQISPSHSIQATTTISEEALRQYLDTKGASNLLPFASQILESPYWSTIIGICTIEEYSCSVNPYETNNLWGLMSGGHLIKFSTLGDGITAIDTFLAKAERNGRTTIESFRGWYCASECTNWESTVINTKEKLEAL